MNEHEQPRPFVWERITGETEYASWDDVDIAQSDTALQRGYTVTVPVSRLADFEAFVRQIREEVEGGS